MKKITLRNSFMKKLLMLLASCTPLLVYSADPQALKFAPITEKNIHNVTVIRTAIPTLTALVPTLKNILGADHNYSKTALGFDFDETLVYPAGFLPPSKSVRILLKRSLNDAVGGGETYKAALEAKKQLGLDKQTNLLVHAIEKGGYVDALKKGEYEDFSALEYRLLTKDKNNELTAQDIEQALKMESKEDGYVYTEDKRDIKPIVKTLQDLGPFIAICTAGNEADIRTRMAKDLAFHGDNWTSGSGDKKYENLMNLAKENYQIKKSSRVVEGKPVYEQEYDTAILVDDKKSYIDAFIKQATEDPQIKVKTVIGIQYTPDTAISPESIIKEYNTIVGNDSTSDAPSSWWDLSLGVSGIPWYWVK